jgi:uncharacterized protein
MAVAGAHRVAVDAAGGDARSPAPLDGVVDADDHRPLRHQGGDDQIEQGPGQRAALPAPAVQHLVIDGEVGGLGPPGHAQAGADGALARREQRTHDQDEQVLPGRAGDMRAKRLQPHPKNLGDGIAAGGGSDRMVLHPMLRIPGRPLHNTSSLRRIDSPPCRHCRFSAQPKMRKAKLMTRRSGSADLPLHNGRVPPWLGERMARLGAVVTEAIVHHYGRDEFLRRIAHPFWFQSFGAVMGMDWHSSGITTSVLGALKRGLAPLAGELGLHVCGGRGRYSRRTPDELLAVADRTGLDGDALGRASRLVAKVDSAAVQDGYELYLHGFIVADDGKWVVVQQGMNGDTRYARRYHWLSEGVASFVEAPHAAIDGRNAGEIVNLTDRRAAASRAGQLELLHELGPDGIVREAALLAAGKPAPSAPTLPRLVMPAYHEVRPKDVMLRRLHGALAAAADRGPDDFTDLPLVPGIGARTVRSLALVAEVIHGAPCRFADPARHSLAHGGKDRQPFPVPTKVYDQDDRCPEGCLGAGEARPGRPPPRDPPARRRSAPSRAHGLRSDLRQLRRRGAPAFAQVWRAQRVRLGDRVAGHRGGPEGGDRRTQAEPITVCLMLDLRPAAGPGETATDRPPRSSRPE